MKGCGGVMMRIRKCRRHVLKTLLCRNAGHACQEEPTQALYCLGRQLDIFAGLTLVVCMVAHGQGNQ